ncbi:hypothetical protein SESBI_39816 [Sesbania bispinosa]|nr:hypothetical protein SESBI_39816 [Sesbania bispinosa]
MKDSRTVPNPNLNQVSEDIVDTDLYGEWISVTKSRKGNKSRAADSHSRGKAPVDKNGNLGGNQFVVLSKNSQGQPAQEVTNGNQNLFVAGPSETQKDMQPRLLSQSKAKGEPKSSRPKLNETKSLESPSAQVQIIAKSPIVKCLTSNIKTTINVEVMGPNRLRFLEPEPPDGAEPTQGGNPTSIDQEAEMQNEMCEAVMDESQPEEESCAMIDTP